MATLRYQEYKELALLLPETGLPSQVVPSYCPFYSKSQMPY